MDFTNNKAIYLQIVDLFLDNILKEKFKPNDRIPSVRNLAQELQVTPNTAMRSYQYLQDKGLIYNKRGIGYFISENAYDIALEIKKNQFVNEVLPSFFKEMEVLKLSFSDLQKFYEQFKNQKQ